jgi:hypothetical protein
VVETKSKLQTQKRRLNMHPKLTRIAALIMASVLIVAITSYSTIAATIQIDNFTNTTLGSPLSITSGSTSAVDSPVAGALDGVRDFSLTHVSGSGAVSLGVDTSVGQLAFASAPNTQGNFTCRWDGSAGSSTPSLNEDLSDSGNNDGFIIAVYADQIGWQMQIDVRDQSDTTTASYSLTENEDIRGTGRIYYIPFTSFSNSTVLTGGNVGYIELTVTGVVDLDLTVDFFDSVNLQDNLIDLGDLPTGYGVTTLANNGAGHLNPGTGTRLGATVDSEPDGQPNADAQGDDPGGVGDEDGVTFTGNWSGGTGYVTVTVGVGRGCLSAWLDWSNGGFTVNPDGDFDDLGENIIDNQPVNIGDNGFTFSIPDPSSDTVYARFRVVPDRDDDGVCSDQDPLYVTSLADGGEVEDYEINFDTNAVTLSDAATQANHIGLAVAASIILLGAGTATFFILRKRRKAQI